MLENIPYTIDKYDVSACTLIMKYLATHMKNNNTHKKENKKRWRYWKRRSSKSF